jgi:hypothetical protein
MRGKVTLVEITVGLMSPSRRQRLNYTEYRVDLIRLHV